MSSVGPWLEDLIVSRGLPGMAVAVTDREELVSFHGAGWADLERLRVDETTLFELGSIGKTFTAVLVLRLADQGAIDLEAPVTRYLPWFEVRTRFGQIAIEHLLTHSAGLIRGSDVTADSRFDVWALRATETGFAPGERHYYSNVGYRVLGYVLEAVAGKTYSELVQEGILEPLAMQSSAAAITNDLRLRFAVGYERLHEGGPRDPADPLVPAPWVATDTADGCIAATAGDLATFARFLLDGEAERLTSGTMLEADDGWSYGYGLETKTVEGRRCFRHGGSMPGYSATMLGDLDSGLAAAVLLNGTDEGDVTEEVAAHALALARGEPSASPPGDLPGPDPTAPPGEPREDLAPFCGRFASYNPWLAGFRIEPRGDGLALVYGWGPEDALVPLGEAKFRVGEDWSPERLRFDAIVEGKALRANLSGENYYRSDFD